MCVFVYIYIKYSQHFDLVPCLWELMNRQWDQQFSGGPAPNFFLFTLLDDQKSGTRGRECPLLLPFPIPGQRALLNAIIFKLSSNFEEREEGFAVVIFSFFPSSFVLKHAYTNILTLLCQGWWLAGIQCGWTSFPVRCVRGLEVATPS